jgi:hypothetical protein
MTAGPEVAHVAPVASAVEGGRPFSVRGAWLAALYLLVPICAAVIALDELAWHGAIRRMLPPTPNALVGFTAVFVLPHIFASLFTFADRDYLATYRSRLLWGVPAIVALTAGLYLIGGPVPGIVFWATTLWHVLAQQTGIAKVFARAPGPLVSVWGWSLVVAFTAGGIGLFWRPILIPSLVLLGLSTLLCVPVAFRTKNRVGFFYIWGTQSMAILTAAAALLGHPFLAILLPRVVHDVTAFTFYLVHDHNRNRERGHNFVLRAFSFTRLPVFVLALLVPLAVNLVFQLSTLGVEALVIGLSFFHYFTESFMWKRHAPHRRQVPVMA